MCMYYFISCAHLLNWATSSTQWKLLLLAILHITLYYICTTYANCVFVVYLKSMCPDRLFVFNIKIKAKLRDLSDLVK